MNIHQYRNLFALGTTSLLLAVAPVVIVWGQEPSDTETGTPSPVTSTRRTRDKLKDKQLDVSLETRDIERVLGKLKKASELAKQRITEAATTTESVTTSLNKGDSKTAQSEAKQASEKFKEIVKQLQALLKEETPQQIAEAKQLAMELAKLEREFADEFEGALNPPQVTSSGESKLNPKSQIKPMMESDMKAKGSGGTSESTEKQKGKSDTKSKQTETGSPTSQTSDQNPDSQKFDKPMPQGQSDAASDGKNDQTPNADDKNSDGSASNDQDTKKPGAGQDKDARKPGDEKKPDGRDGKGPDTKQPGEGLGQDQDIDPPKSEGGDSTKVKSSDDKTEQGQNGSSDVQQSDKNRKENGKTKVAKSSDKDAQGRAGMSAAQLREAVARRAEKLVETGKTLQDVLNAIARSNDPADKVAVARIQDVLKEFDINKIVDQMEGVSSLVRARKDSDAKLSSLDLAERLEIMAQRLDAAYRGIIAPQAEELRKREAALAVLREKLNDLESPAQVTAWHREVREVLDQLDRLGVNPDYLADLEKEMKLAGFDVDGVRRTLTWSLLNDHYVVPIGYNVALTALQEEVQTRIQTLILGDFGNLSDEATPPKYQEFVERYYEVLSGDREGKVATQKSKPKMHAKASK